MSGICPCTLGNSVAGALFNLQNAKKLNRRDREPEQSASATVLSRRVETVYSLTRSDSSWGYFVRFRTENDEEIELSTTEEQYGSLREGLCLKLSWKGSTLLSFAEE